MRKCFFTVSWKKEPPFTVASLAMIAQGMPATMPMPVTTPAHGTSLPYSSQAASGDNSRNGDSGSIR